MPPKAIYEQFDNEPGLQFAYSLAAELGMLVADLEARISNREYIAWNVYFGRLQQQRELAKRG